MTTETSSQMIRPQVDMFEQPDPAAHLSTRFCGNVVTLSISEEANPKDQVVFKCSDITDCWRNLYQTSPVVKHKQSCCRVILGQSIGQSLGHIWDRSRSPWLNWGVKNMSDVCWRVFHVSFLLWRRLKGSCSEIIISLYCKVSEICQSFFLWRRQFQFVTKEVSNTLENENDWKTYTSVLARSRTHAHKRTQTHRHRHTPRETKERWRETEREGVGEWETKRDREGGS